jgi:CO/xanthine dehydrogenase FAD-binding subunit
MIRDFVYLKPGTLDEALALLSEHRGECKVIGGGQSLLILMRQGLVTPAYLIDIKHLDELNSITFDNKDGLKIGATTTHRTIETSEAVKAHFPVLVEMEQNVASIQTRNWGTIGGNLAHADPAGDPGPVLIALDASFRVANTEQERTISADAFFLDYFETALQDDELLLEVKVPTQKPKTGTAYEKFTIIKNDLGIASVAASVTVDKVGKCTKARIALGAVAPTARRAIQAEQDLLGQTLGEDLLNHIAQKASEEAKPISDIHASEDFRRHLVKVLAARMVAKAWKQAIASA